MNPDCTMLREVYRYLLKISVVYKYFIKFIKKFFQRLISLQIHQLNKSIEHLERNNKNISCLSPICIQLILILPPTVILLIGIWYLWFICIDNYKYGIRRSATTIRIELNISLIPDEVLYGPLKCLYIWIVLQVQPFPEFHINDKR